MKKIKIAIMILIGLLIILSIIMLSLKKDHNMANEGTEEAEKQDEEIALPNNSTQETNTYLFFAIEEIAKQALENNTQSNQKVLYNMTSMEYIQQNNIKMNNITSVYPDAACFYAQEEYKIEKSDKAIYYVYGWIQENDIDELKDYYLKIKIDKTNKIFSIEPSNIAEYQKAKNGKIQAIEKFEIKENKDNIYEIKHYTTQNIASKYLNDYIVKTKYKADIAFDLLEENYKKEKFGTIQQFQSYIQSNKERFENIRIQSVQKEIEEDGIKYTIIDTNNHSYQLYEYGALNYKMTLDQ